MPSFTLRVSVLVLTGLMICIFPSCLGFDSAAAAGAESETADPAAETARRQTAVALNYCRAALHRIRRNPEKRVLLEEQQRILNNLDLNRIDDAEVISLYKSVLDEIGSVEITDRERLVIEEQFRRGVHRQLGTDFFVIGAQVATGQVGNAIQSGANSWWDYRNNEVRRDSDLWKVEKSQFTSLMGRSSTFLDSFWKLSRKNEIPDRWLVRDDDLDHLARALQLPVDERRLRVLQRMERFMECYPPYWYYLARTQQQLGLPDKAMETYRRLTELGSGHFRQDDMLASSAANMALLQELNGDPDAARTASRAFDFSTRNWESNLICAWVLGRHAEYSDAEDLLYANLDDGLETDQSQVALVSLYYHSENKLRLAEMLSDPKTAERIPVPGLLLCARLLGSEGLPEAASGRLASTFEVLVQRRGPGESIAVSASHGWKLNDASPEVSWRGRPLRAASYRALPSGVRAEFRSERPTESEAIGSGPIDVTLNYPGTPEIHVRLMPDARHAVAADRSQHRTLLPIPSLSPRLSLTEPVGRVFGNDTDRYRISEIELEGVRLSFLESQPVRDTDLEDETREISLDNGVSRS